MKVPLPGVDASRPGPRHVGELFTDRLSEAAAFKATLRNFRQRLDIGDDGSARHNVLTFYGLGGIGKSALSERLEDWVGHRLPWLEGWGPPPEIEVDATARIDLHGSAGQLDLLATLVSLRTGVASLPRRFPMFDLAFAAYWSAVRPGEFLPRHRANDDLGSSVTDLVKDALSDVGSALDVAGAGVGGGLAVRGVRKLASEIRRRKDVRLGIATFAGFEEFLLRCADEPSATEPCPHLGCEIAGLLALELLRSAPCPLITVFVDTTERLRLDQRRVGESYLNELVWRMPNVLFVLTGRDMLSWWDETETPIPYTGLWLWPGLAPGATEEPRQHLIGDLSPEDTRSLIRLGRRMFDLPMSDAVVEELVVASAGLPQYLELARQVAISIKASGSERTVSREDVTGSLKSLVMRVLDDVPADEQRAIRAACLFQAFDTDLMAAAADVDRGCAERAVQRPMIDRYDGERFPYRMHDAVREAIRHTDHSVTGGWSERDWELAAARAAAVLREGHDQAKKREDNREVLDTIGLTIRLTCDQETALGASDRPGYEDWLSQAIVFSPSIQGLYSRVAPDSRTVYGQLVLDFIVGKSLETPLTERLALLRKVFDSDHPLRAPAGRHLGYTLRNQFRWDEALEIFAELTDRAPFAVNRQQRAITLSMARRFADYTEAVGRGRDVPNVGGAVEYVHGRPDRYFTEVNTRIDELRRDGRQREVLEAEGQLLERRVFFGHEVGTEKIATFLDVAELTAHSAATRSALTALVLHRAADQAELALTIERLNGLERASRSHEVIGVRYAWAEFCDALLSDDSGRLDRLYQKVSAVAARSRAWIPLECFFDHIGMPVPEIATQWLEPYPLVRERWAGHLKGYLTRHRT